MDALAALRLQLEWGVDEALGDAPVDRLSPPSAPAAVALSAPTQMRPVAPRVVAVPQASVSAPVARAQELAAAAQDRDELLAALAGFDGCPLSATATNLVFSDGNPDAHLMLVGEGPGAEEDRAGKPFVGPSGRFLDRMLASIDIDRSKCLITNLIPWRPPGNRNPTDSEILVCLPFLLRHIALVQPRWLVLLGAQATQAVTGSSSGIRRMRGKWIEITIPGMERPVLTLPTLHPAYLLRTPGAKRDAWADLISLRRRMDSPGTVN